MTIIVLNADFEDSSNKINYGLDEAITFIGRTQKTCINNYASGEGTFTKAGDLTYNNGAVAVFKGNYINTDTVLDSPEVTVLTIFKQEVQGVSFLASNRNVVGSQAPLAGFSVTCRNTGNMGIQFSCLNASGTASTISLYTPYSTTAYNFLAARVAVTPTSVNTTVQNLVDGTTVQDSKAGYTVPIATLPVQLGSSPELKTGTNENAVPCNMFMTVIVPKALSDEDIAVLAEKMRLYANKYNIVV